MLTQMELGTLTEEEARWAIKRLSIAKSNGFGRVQFLFSRGEMADVEMTLKESHEDIKALNKKSC